MKVVIVDDEIASLAAFVPYIADNERINCKLFRGEPLRALEYVRTENVSAAFLDVRMPGIDGVSLAEKMIAANSKINIIIITAYEQDEVNIRRRLGANLAEIFYKPFDPDRLANLFRRLSENVRPELFIRTFDAFDLFADGRAVNFTSSKAKELLALLVDADGSYVGMDKVMCDLWGDKNTDLGKRLYRDAVCRLRMTLSKIGAEHLVRFERARAVIDKSAAECDLWKFLDGKGTFSGNYLPQYGWSTEREMFLVGLAEERARS